MRSSLFYRTLPLLLLPLLLLLLPQLSALGLHPEEFPSIAAGGVTDACSLAAIPTLTPVFTKASGTGLPPAVSTRFRSVVRHPFSLRTCLVYGSALAMEKEFRVRFSCPLPRPAQRQDLAVDSDDCALVANGSILYQIDIAHRRLCKAGCFDQNDMHQTPAASSPTRLFSIDALLALPEQERHFIALVSRHSEEATAADCRLVLFCQLAASDASKAPASLQILGSAEIATAPLALLLLSNSQTRGDSDALAVVGVSTADCRLHRYRLCSKSPDDIQLSLMDTIFSPDPVLCALSLQPIAATEDTSSSQSERILFGCATGRLVCCDCSGGVSSADAAVAASGESTMLTNGPVVALAYGMDEQKLRSAAVWVCSSLSGLFAAPADAIATTTWPLTEPPSYEVLPESDSSHHDIVTSFAWAPVRSAATSPSDNSIGTCHNEPPYAYASFYDGTILCYSMTSRSIVARIQLPYPVLSIACSRRHRQSAGDESLLFALTTSSLFVLSVHDCRTERS